MKKNISRLFLIMLLLVMLLTGTPLVSRAEQKGLIDADFNNAPTYISSDSLTLFSEKRVLKYLGNVRVIHKEMDLICDRMEAEYDEQNQIQQITAYDNVFIKKGPTIQARGEKAVYQQSSETVTLTKNPELVREGSVLSADLIKIFLKEDRSTAEGEVRVKMIKKDEKKNSPTANTSPTTPSSQPTT